MTSGGRFVACEMLTGRHDAVDVRGQAFLPEMSLKENYGLTTNRRRAHT